jgi:hypothetical protein
MSTNYSLYAIPASWFLATSVHWYAASLTARSKDLPAFDNCSPRGMSNGNTSALIKEEPLTSSLLPEFNAKCRALEKQTPVRVQRSAQTSLIVPVDCPRRPLTRFSC